MAHRTMVLCQQASKGVRKALEKSGFELKKPKTNVRGMDVLRDNRINKGMSFSLRERQFLGIHGLLPPTFYNQHQQAYRVMQNLKRQPHDLARYVQLSMLQDRNEKLFYRVLVDNVEKLMPVVYTPTVGEACQKFGFVYRKPKGIYVSIYDKSVDQIYDILCNWPEDDVRAIVVTDGERILGLGDLGVNGMGIPVGKLSLYVALAGIQPEWCLPVVIDVGTNNQQLLDDPLYIGLKRKRTRGEEYDKLIDNFMKAVVKRFGHDTLVQFEDFANANAFRLLAKYRNKYCTFNDDIQGTASVAVAGLLAAARITKKKVSESKIVFFGAGEASLGIAQLTCMAMMKEGLTEQQARDQIYMLDSKGLLVKGRANMTEHKEHFARADMEHIKDLAEVVDKVKPDAIIGAATIPGVFTESILRNMASFHERPIVMALSNPTSKAECTAEQAYKFTDERAVFASGSPFPDYKTSSGQTLIPGQGNNAYIFPGVALATILSGIRHVTDEHFLIASETLANLVTQKDLDEGRVYPPLADIRELSIQIAVAVMEHAYRHHEAAYYPEPDDKEAFIRAQIYSTHYDDHDPKFYEWPEEHTTKTFDPSQFPDKD